MGHKIWSSGSRQLLIGVTFLLSLVLSGIPTISHAQVCTFTNTGVNFGSVDLSSGSAVLATGTFTAACTGFAGERVRVCANFNDGSGGVSGGGDPRQMTSGVNSLNFNIYKNAAYTNIWGSKVWAHPPTQKTINMRLNGAGTASKSRVIRNEIYSGQAGTPPGLYTSSFAGAHTQISYAYRFVGNCNVISGPSGIHVQVPFTVSANVLGACTVSATDLDFGTTGVLTSSNDTTNTISINCNNLLPYSISLNDGLSGVGDPTARKMVNGPNQITYGIYQDAAHLNPWGDNIGTNTVGGTGTGSVQSYTAHGRVPVQSTPTPGTYTDTIIVTVTY